MITVSAHVGAIQTARRGSAHRAVSHSPLLSLYPHNPRPGVGGVAQELNDMGVWSSHSNDVPDAAVCSPTLPWDKRKYNHRTSTTEAQHACGTSTHQY